MTLEEAIKMYTSNAFYEKSDGNLQGYLDFNQLAEWLKDYKRLLSVIDDIKSEIAERIKLYEGSCDQELGTKWGYEWALEIINKHIGNEKEVGTWVTRSTYWGFRYECSNCKKVLVNKWDYCPFCGNPKDSRNKSYYQLTKEAAERI